MKCTERPAAFEAQMFLIEDLFVSAARSNLTNERACTVTPEKPELASPPLDGSR
jgi:hypothetical protein